MTIRFGTSGWRGLIARDFTFDNVRLAAQGIADYLKTELTGLQSPIHGRKPLLILGHDTRFLGREFSLAAAEVLTANGLIPLLCNRDAPTPVIAHTIRDRKTIGGINMTASHNPAEYQGLKFSTHNGAPATPEVTTQIE
jgi:phosphoglucomutase